MGQDADPGATAAGLCGPRRRACRRPAASGPSWPRASSLFCLALTFLLGVASFGTYVNDEAHQLQGMHNLIQGSMEVEERTPQFFAVQEYVFVGGVNLTAAQNEFVSLSALPAYGVLWATSLVAPPGVVLLLGWTAAAYVSATRGWARWYERRTGRGWSWYRETPEADGDSEDERPRRWARLRTMTPAHWLVVGALALWSFSQAVQAPDVAFGTWGETFAVQTTHILLSAGGMVLFFRVVQHETGSLRTACVAAAALLLGPYGAWGVGIKYHAPSMALAAATLWCYQRPGRWRLAAFVVGALGVAVTPLGVPLLAALFVVEAARAVRTARRGEAAHLRFVVLGLLGAVSLLAAYNHAVTGHWLGRAAPLAEAWGAGPAAVWEWLRHGLRVESGRTSLLNLWRVFVDARAIPGGPVAVWALTPLTVLALLAPLRLRGRWTPTLAVAAVGSLLFVATFVHAAHTQGDGRDNRFFTATLPGLLVLSAAVLAPRLEAVDAGRWRPLRSYGLLLAAVAVLLLLLGATGVSLAAGQDWRQLVNFSWMAGLLTWVALVALEAFHGFWLRRLGPAAVERAWNWAAVALLVPGTVWLFHVLVLTNRVIPPWPFGSDSEGMTFLMPSLDTMRAWWQANLYP